MTIKAKSAVVTIPLTAIKLLYRGQRNKKIVCEIDFPSLQRVNESTTIDEMVAEAQLEYFTGKTRKFKSAKQLVKFLNS